MEIYLLKGRIHKIFDVQSKSPRFAKQEFVVRLVSPTSTGTYTEYIKLQCINDKINYLSDARAGDFAMIKFALKGNKVDKDDREVYFTNLDVQEMSVVKRGDDGPMEVKADDVDYLKELPGLEEQDSLFNQPKEDYEDDLPF